MPFGAELLDAGGTRFRLWAPAATQVWLLLEGMPSGTRRTMDRLDGGWHELVLAEAGAGTRYRYVINGGGDDAVQDDGAGDGAAGSELAVPDPASRSNPDDVHGASQVIDPHAYSWSDMNWRGRSWSEAVVYELHVGTFTPEGTFAAAVQRLPELAALGITAIELMPVADFPGRRGWGYDGVLHYAPDAAYGTPDELKQLIDLAHGLGLMVLLDVVYNHFGPEGNYLHGWCPQFFNPQHHTPWGAAINFDGALNRPVRDFYVHNALYWIEEYHFDGLRLDAVHAIRDDSETHIVCEIGRALRDGPGRERQVHLVLENDANQARWLTRDAQGTPTCATAQWNDDFHHAAHVLVSGETDGYYADYIDEAGRALDCFGRALAEGFIYQGQPSTFREGALRGEPSAHLGPDAFVAFLQNHDQIGNRAFGERLHTFAGPRRLNAAYACLLLSPQIPMLFMGEEFAASTPFLYFCDFGPELAQAVTRGRRDEFKRFAAFADERARERIPDPNAGSSFEACKLRWDERERSPHAERLALIGELLALRHRHLVPRIADIGSGGRYRVEGDLLRVEWPLSDGSVWHLLACFSDHDTEVADSSARQTIYSCGVQAAGAGRTRLEPGAVLVSTGAPDEPMGAPGALASAPDALKGAPDALVGAPDASPGTVNVSAAPPWSASSGATDA